MTKSPLKDLMPKIIIMRGLPGTGKSTASRKETLKGRTIKLSFDELAFSLFAKLHFTEMESKVILRVMTSVAKDAIRYDYNVIIDNLNLDDESIIFWQELAAKLGCESKIIDFQKRDEDRIEGIKERINRSREGLALLYPDLKEYLLGALEDSSPPFSERATWK